jgi:hypothetical protein
VRRHAIIENSRRGEPARELSAELCAVAVAGRLCPQIGVTLAFVHLKLQIGRCRARLLPYRRCACREAEGREDDDLHFAFSLRALCSAITRSRSERIVEGAGSGGGSGSGIAPAAVLNSDCDDDLGRTICHRWSRARAIWGSSSNGTGFLGNERQPPIPLA